MLENLTYHSNDASDCSDSSECTLVLLLSLEDESAHHLKLLTPLFSLHKSSLQPRHVATLRRYAFQDFLSKLAYLVNLLLDQHAPLQLLSHQFELLFTAPCSFSTLIAHTVALSLELLVLTFRGRNLVLFVCNHLFEAVDSELQCTHPLLVLFLVLLA